MRTKVYTALLLFIILAGAPMLAVPHLRQKLFDRVHLLHNAWIGAEAPKIQVISADAIPYPKAFERPAIKAENFSALGSLVRSADHAGDKDKPDSGIKTIQFLDAVKKGAHATSADSDAGNVADEEDAAPAYRQDKKEREAYEIVLKANRKLADMVRGADSALKMKAWGAAHRGDDVYWVRVVFLNREQVEIEYIWEVNLTSQKASPLSYNARSIS